jgi:hypothetical protein
MSSADQGLLFIHQHHQRDALTFGRTARFCGRRFLLPIWVLGLLLVITGSNASAWWSYETTPDGKSKLGRNGSSLSVEVGKIMVWFRVPKSWRVYACTKEPMDTAFSTGDPKGRLSADFTLYEDSRSLPEPELYRNYLEGRQSHNDPKIRMRTEAPFQLPDGRRLTPRRFFSAYWGQRMVLLIPEGGYTCEFVFTAGNSVDGLRKSHGEIQQILSSYKCLHKKAPNLGSRNQRAMP